MKRMERVLSEKPKNGSTVLAVVDVIFRPCVRETPSDRKKNMPN